MSTLSFKDIGSGEENLTPVMDEIHQNDRSRHKTPVTAESAVKSLKCRWICGDINCMEILIAEDDTLSRNLLKNVVLDMGHTVVEAENGRQAWDIVNRRAIRLIISDWMMPEMDGLELCDLIRSKSLGRYIYLVLLTARDHKQDQIKALNAGVDDVLTKPFDPNELRARVRIGHRIVCLEEEHQKLQQTLTETCRRQRAIFDSLEKQILWFF